MKQITILYNEIHIALGKKIIDDYLTNIFIIVLTNQQS